jgi:hypothetical protein
MIVSYQLHTTAAAGINEGKFAKMDTDLIPYPLTEDGLDGVITSPLIFKQNCCFLGLA